MKYLNTSTIYSLVRVEMYYEDVRYYSNVQFHEFISSAILIKYEVTDKKLRNKVSVMIFDIINEQDYPLKNTDYSVIEVFIKGKHYRNIRVQYSKSNRYQFQ